MAITPNSLAMANGVSVSNTQLKTSVSVLARKILIIGSYDPAKTAVQANKLAQIFSPEDAASKYGNGSMLHRLALASNLGAQGVETWVVPQAEASGAVAASGSVLFAGTTILAGTIYAYIGGESIAFSFAGGTPAQLATAYAAAINADTALNVTAAVNGTTPEQVDITSKTKGTFGNDVIISFNEKSGEAFPSGLTSATVTPMASGSGIPDIQDALDALGTGDAQNEAYFTDVIHGYGKDSTTLDAISTYNGIGNLAQGNYSKTVNRPFRSLIGDNTPDSAGQTAVIALGNGRKLDRTNGVVSVPGSPTHPAEIAAEAVAICARLNGVRAEENAGDQILQGVMPGQKSERWSDDYDNRDLAVAAGVSPTRIKNGVVTLQNVVTFYHPDDVPAANNGYRNYRNISLLQNITNSVFVNFSLDKWKGISIVKDVTKVTNVNSAKKARDVDSVINDFVALVQEWEKNAWIYAASYTLENLSVTIRDLVNGFDSVIPIVLSGQGDIYDTLIEFDTSIAVFI